MKTDVDLKPTESCQPRKSLFLIILLAALARPAVAQECNTAPIATDDEIFHNGKRLVVDVLANDFEPDGESLAIINLTTTCDASVSEDFGLVLLLPADPRSEACQIDYQVEDDRGATASATVTVRDTGVIFNDGFESGDTSAWPDVEP